ncbi:MAG: DUF4097 family beta strand repeat-containing protein [Acidobacteriota bacterium]
MIAHLFQRAPSLSLLMVAASAAAFALPAWADCDHQAKRQLSESLSGIDRVEVVARAGDLRIDASQGDTLEATGKACASKKSLLEDVQLVAERRGSVLRVEASIPKTSGWNQSARLDMKIELPGNVSLEVEDGSGDLELRGVSVEALDDGSGDARLDGTRGDLRIVDGSGGITIREHRGDLELRDGSGDLRIRDSDGRVVITDDGSGDIDITGVSGDVHIKSDGSGDIEVDTVGGDLRIGSAGSGDVRFRDVRGSTDVPKDR